VVEERVGKQKTPKPQIPKNEKQIDLNKTKKRKENKMPL
jgi:hypothetical protein